jgi:hypothetical protein
MTDVKFTLTELLPPAAEEDIEAANFDLVTLHAPVSVAYDRFCQRLDEKGIEPPSLRSFRRWAAACDKKKTVPANVVRAYRAAQKEAQERLLKERIRELEAGRVTGQSAGASR